jgi:hypothetical protein
MGYEIPLQSITLEAAADLSTKQYHAIKVDANGKAALASAGEPAVGVLQNDPGIGQAATVMVFGVTKAIYGASVAPGNKLMVNADGQFVPYAAPGAGATNHVVGVALTGGAAGEEGAILLKSFGFQTA